jgi:hypothetical protein
MSAMYRSSMINCGSLSILSLLVAFVDASLCAGTAKGDEGLLLDLGVERVERLRHVVVEGAGLSVVLARNGNDGADLLGLN